MILSARALALSGRLDPIDLELRSGELVCIVGPNGGGKTSLLHGISGVGRPSGEVRLDGVKLDGLPPPLRMRQLAFLPASRDLPWPITAKDVVKLGLAVSDAENSLDPLMDALDLAKLAERRVDRLSTGERSRVLIARALISSPKLILLDEPTSNLDPLWQLRLMDLLHDLARREDRIVAIAIHDIGLAARYADRILIMDRGRIAADGSPTNLLDSEAFRTIFGIERSADGWRAIIPPADPQSSR